MTLTEAETLARRIHLMIDLQSIAPQDTSVPTLAGIILEACPAREPPLLQCTDCKNTESPAGAMARQFNHGRCVHCGGYFKVVRA